MMSDTTDSAKPVRWSLLWWTCVIMIAGTFALNLQLYMLREESSSGWFHIETRLRGIQVDAELHREREAHQWRAHPGDRRIPGGESEWVPLTSPESEDEEPQ
jgi:hypothetical protein